MSDVKIELYTTERGFTVYSFTDLHEWRCILQEGGLADKPHIWLGISRADQRLRLSQDLVRALLPILQRFADTGELGE